MAVEIESIPWCARFDSAIDDHLINERRPVCVTEHGCYYCDQKYQKEIEVIYGSPEQVG